MQLTQRLSEIPVRPAALTGQIITGMGKPAKVWLFGLPQPDGTVEQVLAIEGMASMTVAKNFRPIDLVIGGCDLLTAQRVADMLSSSQDKSDAGLLPAPGSTSPIEGN